MASLKYSKLSGKSVLIFGGSSGIGYGVAEASLESGAHVTISSSSSKVDAAVQKLRESYPQQTVQGFACNLISPTAEQEVEAIFEKVGTVNHVVFTAADSLSLMMLQDLKPELIQHATQMRLVAPFMVAKVAARRLAKSRESSITITTGIAAYASTPGWSLVSFLASGLMGMTKALATEIAPIRMNCVMAGFVDTPLWTPLGDEAWTKWIQTMEAKMPTGKVGQVEDVAEAFLWLMKDRNATGTVAETDSGALVLPGY